MALRDWEDEKTKKSAVERWAGAGEAVPAPLRLAESEFFGSDAPAAPLRPAESEFFDRAPAKAAPAPEPVRVPAPIPELPEPERPSFLSRLASAAPSLAVGIGHMAGAGSGTQESRGTLARLMQQGNEEIATADQRYTAQRRANARNRQQRAAAQAAAKRQAGLDAENAKTNALKREEMGLNIAKGKRTEADAAEADDPGSAKNVSFRAELQRTEPDVWASLTPEQQASIRLKDAEGLALGLAESKRTKKLTDDKDKIKYQQQMEKEYDTSKPSVIYTPMSPVSIEDARKRVTQIFEGKPNPAFEARVENVANLPPQEQAKAIDSIMRDAAAAKSNAGGPKTAGNEEMPPPDGWEVIPTPGSKAAWAQSQRDAKGRDAVRGVTNSLPGIKNNLKRMMELRKLHGTEAFSTEAASEYENLRTATIGYLNRAISDAGVLNRGEYEVWRDRLLEMGPQVRDLQRFVGMGDPVLRNLQGAHDAMDSVVANTAGAYGLRQIGKSAGQKNVADNATQVGGVTPGQDAKRRQLVLPDGSTAPDTPKNREILDGRKIQYKVQ